VQPNRGDGGRFRRPTTLGELVRDQPIPGPVVVVGRALHVLAASVGGRESGDLLDPSHAASDEHQHRVRGGRLEIGLHLGLQVPGQSLDAAQHDAGPATEQGRRAQLWQVIGLRHVVDVHVDVVEGCGDRRQLALQGALEQEIVVAGEQYHGVHGRTVVAPALSALVRRTTSRC
jgi:hypothetical protein